MKVWLSLLSLSIVSLFVLSLASPTLFTTLRFASVGLLTSMLGLTVAHQLYLYYRYYNQKTVDYQRKQ